MQLQEVIQLLTRYPSVAAVGLSYEDLQLFCDIVRWFKDEIASFQPSYITTPPDTLPIKIHNILMGALSLSSEDTKLLWTALRDLAWEVPQEDMQHRAYSLIPILLQHAVRQGLGTSWQ
ncbi:hypothetical protein LXA43DRAFT_901016 [Ganoderma leucocontextum]|nr:hypothetical protein LXA43DRAFT_901016 [Ganoderma leucocontextum]